MLWDMYYSYLLFFPASILLFGNFFFFLKNKKVSNNILNILSGLNVNMYYYIVFVLCMGLLCLHSRFEFLSNSLIFYFFFCTLIYLTFLPFFATCSRSTIRCVPTMVFSMCTVFPIYLNTGFLGYVLMAEFGSSFLFIVFLLNSNDSVRNKNNNALLSIIIYNFTTLVFFFIAIIFLINIYGTTDLHYLGILNNYSLFENFILMFCISSLLLKLGFFPLFFFKRSIYNGLGVSSLILYTFFYNLFFIAPTIFYLIGFLMLLNNWYQFLVIIFMITSIMPNLLNTKNLSDFLPLSTLIFSVFVTVMCV